MFNNLRDEKSSTDGANFLKPYFRTKIWGGRKLSTIFHYDIPQVKVGEAWIISGYQNNASIAANGLYQGQSLRRIYHEQPQLFGFPQAKEFPLLVKYLDANDNLSVQVHPDDEYAARVEHDSGKTESWYVLQADPGACLIYGHYAQTKKQLESWVKNGEWDRLLRKVPIKAGDFFYVPAGTIHALTKGSLVIETQQSSDVTYRLYDYDRVDAKTGKKRQLHTKKSLAVIKVPHHDPKTKFSQKKTATAEITTLAQPPYSPHFYLWHIKIAGNLHESLHEYSYLLVSVIAGQGKIKVADKEYSLVIGKNFILTNDCRDFMFTGHLELIISAPVNQGE